jgi:ornithine cyclodeaminase
VVLADDVQPGAHVNAVGAFTPSTRELPARLIGRARVYVDTRAGALTEAGELLLAAQDGEFQLTDVAGEIGEVILNTTAGRSNPGEVTVYKSVGAAFLDAATARLAYDQAGLKGMGIVYEFDAQ